jgi:hypothetical protein
MKYDITDGASFRQAMAAIEKKLNVKVESVTAEVAKAVADCALDCLDNAVQRAPVETGDLRSSGYANFNGSPFLKGRGDASGGAGIDIVGVPTPAQQAEAEIGFAAVYAHRQHEDMNYRHDRTDGYRRPDGTTVNMVAGGQAKYLESVVVEKLPKWRKHIRDAAKRGTEAE